MRCTTFFYEPQNASSKNHLTPDGVLQLIFRTAVPAGHPCMLLNAGPDLIIWAGSAGPQQFHLNSAHLNSAVFLRTLAAQSLNTLKQPQRHIKTSINARGHGHPWSQTYRLTPTGWLLTAWDIFLPDVRLIQSKNSTQQLMKCQECGWDADKTASHLQKTRRPDKSRQEMQLLQKKKKKQHLTQENMGQAIV